jgi:hypothetical protein
LLGLRGLKVRERLLEAADGTGHGAVRGRRAGKRWIASEPGQVVEMQIPKLLQGGMQVGMQAA